MSFPPRLKLKGKDADGWWKVAIVGVMYTNADPSDDPTQPERVEEYERLNPRSQDRPSEAGNGA